MKGWLPGGHFWVLCNSGGVPGLQCIQCLANQAQAQRSEFALPQGLRSVIGGNPAPVLGSYGACVGPIV